MILALFSDIHANLRAFDACLAHARAQGANQIAVLGDLVGYGAEPCEVMDRVMALAAEGAQVVKGNHDVLSALPPGDVAKTLDAQAAVWTRTQLKLHHRSYIDQLPYTLQIADCLLVHAGAEAPERWHYVNDSRSASASLDAAVHTSGVRHVFGGHVHHQTLYYRGAGRGLMAFAPTAGVPIPLARHRQWIATVGSVGQPRDGDHRAMYALFDAGKAQMTFFRVPYDHQGAAAAIRQTGQSEFFAQRLEDGR